MIPVIEVRAHCGHTWRLSWLPWGRLISCPECKSPRWLRHVAILEGNPPIVTANDSVRNLMWDAPQAA